MVAETDRLEEIESADNAENAESNVHAICSEVRLTPEQCNEIIEDKLTHLLPALRGALLSMKQVNHRLANGEISWRRLLEKAKIAVSEV